MRPTDLAALLEPIDGDRPTGPDLEYDPEFLALERAASDRPEQQFGGTIVPAEPPDWKAVTAAATTLMARSKDLRVAVQLSRSWTVQRGVDGLADGLALLHGLLARYWDGLHPALDADDDDGPLMRMNALAALVDPTVGLKAVRGADWLVHGGVRCDVRTGLRVLGIEPDGPEPDLSPTALERLIRAAAGSGVGNSARRAIETARTLAALLDERVGAHRAPDLKPLSQMLRPLADAFDRAAGVEVGASPVPEAGATPQAAGASDVASPAAAAPGRIASREDASRALDAVCEWLERQEPANPAPLLIRRAQRLMTMNFLDIMRDMAPDALGAVETIAGRQPDSE